MNYSYGQLKKEKEIIAFDLLNNLLSKFNLKEEWKDKVMRNDEL